MREVIAEYARPAARFVLVTVAPAVVLTLLAVVIGLVRTAALLGFVAVVLLRAGFLALERFGASLPGPRLVAAAAGGER